MCFLVLSACGDDEGGDTQPATTPQTSTQDAGGDTLEDTGDGDAGVDTAEDASEFVPEDLNDGVVLTLLTVPGAQAPANPTTQEQTPEEASQARFVRYTLGEPSAESTREGVVVLVPGFLGGAGSFDPIARQIVQETNGRFEVWAVDRRSNALEDLRGANAAERLKNPEIAAGYYFQGEAVDGVTFEGLKTQRDLSFMSEWGVQVHMQDLRAVLSLIPEDKRETHVFLGGHSLGASLVQIYASYAFENDHVGHNDIAGLMLFDGGVTPNPEDSEPLTREQFLDGFQGGIFGSVEGLTSLRDNGGVIVEFPFIDPELFAMAEVVAMRASRYTGNPTATLEDERISQFLALTMNGARPKGTHEAMLGFAFDTQFQPLAFFNMNLGTAEGGPVMEYESLFAPGRTMLSPSDPNTVYTWTSGNADSPTEPTRLQDFALSLYAGPSNFAEWYFPTRLTLDVAAIADLQPPTENDWRLEFGLRTTNPSSMDAPVFAVAAVDGLVPTRDRYDYYRSIISPTLRSQDPRDDSQGYLVIEAQNHAHLDVVQSDARTVILRPMISWMEAVTQGQTLQVNLQNASVVDGGE